MDSFRTIFNGKLTFTLKTHRTAFVITVKFPNLLKRIFQNSYYWVFVKLVLICSANQWTSFYMITASVLKELSRLMLVKIDFREINFSGISRKFVCANFFVILLSIENKSLILVLKIFNYKFSWYIFWFCKNLFFPAIIVLRINITELANVKISQREILPSTKINPRNIWKNLHPRKSVHAKINLVKIDLRST